MALSAPTLSAAIRAARLAGNPGANVVDGAELTADCDAIAQAVVAHIIAAAVVTVQPGIPIAGTGGGPSPVVGATTAPGVGAIT